MPRGKRTTYKYPIFTICHIFFYPMGSHAHSWDLKIISKIKILSGNFFFLPLKTHLNSKIKGNVPSFCFYPQNHFTNVILGTLGFHSWFWGWYHSYGWMTYNRITFNTFFVELVAQGLSSAIYILCDLQAITHERFTRCVQSTHPKGTGYNDCGFPLAKKKKMLS